MNISDHDKYDTAVDPCPECGVIPEGWESKPEYVQSNPDAVIATPNPDCPNLTDPDAECICPPPIINPYPNPALDQITMVANWTTFTPCAHRFEQTQLDEAGWKITRTVRPGWHARQIARLREDAAKLGVTPE